MRKIALYLLMALLSGLPAQARVLAITPEQVKRLGIETAPVRPAETQSAISVLGHITPAPNSRIPVSAPFAGAVKSLVKLEGETVRKGDPLVVIISADMHAAQAKLASENARYRSTKAAADRAKALVAEGIAPASRAEQANAEAAAAAAELAASQRLMSRVTRSGNDSYRLLAPADGRISSIDVSVGEQVAAMQPVLTVDTRQELWVEAALPASAVGRVAAGDTVTVEGIKGVTGEVVAAGTSIDPRTRSATMRARLAGSTRLVSGQTVRLSILRKAQAGSFNVPRAAVVELKDGPAVFVVRKGGFEPLAVRVLARGPQDATIQGRLGKTDSVAIRGLTELKAVSMQD